ncbi:MAG TPA: hypothetical protein VGK73_02295, partial [Polyangiaceae bacterium]
MNDPTRWSEDDTELDADERRLLRAGLRPDAPRSAKRAVWLAIGAQLPPIAAAASSAGATSLTLVSLLKTAGIGVVLGATTMGAVAFVGRQPAEPAPAGSGVRNVPAPLATGSVAAPPAIPAAPEAAPSALPSSVTRAPRSANEPARAEPSAPARSEAAFPEEASGAARDLENQRVRAARGLLRAGRTQDALTALEELRRDLPNGELAQEREAL